MESQKLPKSESETSQEPTFLHDAESPSQFPTFVTRKTLSERFATNSSDTLESTLLRHVTNAPCSPASPKPESNQG
ncbi:hypothetical protein BLA13014_04588 [Burkholderia aenigmatica]|uniref:Uncharacterized protein n=1 Tax=Burkholderia aenigmatica TaxID=2015348 RepID=A0A6P2NT32_9BURK|nr:hypothetical protein BLA13014_04588 [Burkholderia aenigmatica]